MFCKFATSEISVPFIFETDKFFAINDIAPQAPVHILLIPKVHVENAALLAKVEPETLADLFEAAATLAQAHDLDGYRTLFNTGEGAGQSVFHAHLHLLGGRTFAWPPG